MKIGTFNLLAGSGLLALTSIASAQTAPTPADGDLVEVFVTARRVEEKLQDVPISMTVFSQEQITKANIVNATDLAAITPSLSANNNYGNENASFAMRGFVQDPGTMPSVGVYFADVVAPRAANNGVPVGDGAGPGSFFDLQNVQVLKGPQGTLQGRNTTGGAILFVPVKPSSDFGGYAEISAGNYNMKRTQGAINIPFSDTIKFRLAADYQNRDGYATNNASIKGRSLGTDFYDVNYYAVRASLVVDLTPSLETYVIGSFGTSHTRGNVEKVIACDPHPAGLALTDGCTQLNRNNARGDSFYTLQSTIDSPSSELQTWQVIDTTTWKASDSFTLKNIISYAELSDILRTAQFGTDWRGGTLPLAYIQPPPGGKTADQSTFTEELQAIGSAFEDDRVTYQSGLYFESSKPLGPSGNQSPFLINCKNSDYPTTTNNCIDTLGSAGNSPQGVVNYTVGETEFQDIGIYTQLTFKVTDKFKVTTGYRYTWDSQVNNSTLITYSDPHPKPADPTLVPGDDGYTGHVLGEGLQASCSDPTSDTDHTLTPIPDPGNPTVPLRYFDPANGCKLRLEKKSSAPTWLLDLNYHFTDDVMVYADYKRGYRAGGVLIGAPADKRIFEPESVENYELGMKSTFRGAVNGTFNIAAFYNDFTNQQLQLPYVSILGGRPHTTGIINAGKSTIYGAEVETAIKPTKNWLLSVSYTYLNTEVNQVDDSKFVSTDPAYTSTPPVAVGNPLTLSPKNKYAISATYTLPLSDTIGKISLGVTFVHTDEQISTFTYINDPHVPNYAARSGGDWGTLAARDLYNANVDWNELMGLPLDLSFFGTNLTNQQYYNFVPGVIAAGFEVASLGEPRMYGARLRYRF